MWESYAKRCMTRTVKEIDLNSLSGKVNPKDMFNQLQIKTQEVFDQGLKWPTKRGDQVEMRTLVDPKALVITFLMLS